MAKQRIPEIMYSAHKLAGLLVRSHYASCEAVAKRVTGELALNGQQVTNVLTQFNVDKKLHGSFMRWAVCDPIISEMTFVERVSEQNSEASRSGISRSRMR